MKSGVALVNQLDDLRRQLADAEAALKALAGGEVDAVAHDQLTTPLLLHRAQEELRQREQLFRAVFEGVDEGILLVDSHGVFLDANPATCALFGVGKAEIVGRCLEDFAAREPGVGAGQGWGLLTVSLPDGDRRELESQTKRDILPNLHLLVVRDVTQLNQARNALRASEEHYRVLFESCPLPIWLTDLANQRFLAVNQAALQLFGYERDEFLALTVTALLEGPERSRVERELQALVGGGVQHGTRRAKKKDGAVVELAATAQAFVLEGRQVALVIAQDMTERKFLEAQLAQSRKMEAIGALAGGIAHDFNNLLSIIVSYSAFALEALGQDDPTRADIAEVAEAGRRAVGLTRQLLAFSRQQILEPTVLDLNDTVANIEPMLRRLVGEHVEISTLLDPSLGRVSADPGQIEQVIMNLVVNARDAMPAGGEVTIETSNVNPGELKVDAPVHKLGACVRLAVSDSGSGMDALTLERIFEPFFTTKEVGRGTGLGLSTVLGIVKQSGGELKVESELGKGSRFEIFLPRVDKPLPRRTVPPALAVPVGGSERVLVVEDDVQVRALCRTILQRIGYQVLVAANAGEALLIAEEQPGPIDLLVTDVVMPRMNGRQLAERLALSRPELRVLYMTGYTNDAILRQGVVDADIVLLQKPFTALSLSRSVRSVLDAPSGAIGR